MSARGEFSSRLGFILAASGSAVGLGNIWGFPTQAASNGGGAFLLVYLFLTFLLAYPVFVAETVIGRYAKANVVDSLKKVAADRGVEPVATVVGITGMTTAVFILGFYSVVAGWMVANLFGELAEIVGQDALSAWFTTSSIPRDVGFSVGFLVITLLIIRGGVSKGIERWSTRLMPVLLTILIGLVVYVLTLDGASDGLRAYLTPDLDKALKPELMVSAMGQSFFSLSIGVGSMLIYGSYVSKSDNMPRLGLAVTLIDVGIAILAGLLILPAIYVALASGIEVFDASGKLVEGPGMIFSVLPALFDTIGPAGIWVGAAFFALMSIAALTSSISMLEVPVPYLMEVHGRSRGQAAFMIALVALAISVTIVLTPGWVFNAVVTGATEYSQPLLSLCLCLFVGWIWHRHKLLSELMQGYPEIETSLFWRWWPTYVRFICPLGILVVFLNGLR